MSNNKNQYKGLSKAEKIAKRQADRAARRQARRDERYTSKGGGITYNSQDTGKRAFMQDDVKYLQDQGYTDKQIREHLDGIERRNINARTQVDFDMHDQDFSDLENYDPLAIGSRNAYDEHGNFSQEKFNLLKAKGRTADLQGAEVRALMEKGGHSAQEINEWAKKNNYTLGNKAQDFLNNRLARMNKTTPSEITATPEDKIVTFTLPKHVEQVVDSGNINDSFNTDNSQKADFDANQSVGNDKFKNNVYSTNVGGSVFGNMNIGNDNAISVISQAQEQNRGGDPYDFRGSMGHKDGGIDNFASGVTTMALLDNDLARSQANLSGVGRSAQASLAGEKLTGNIDRINNLDFISRMNPYLMKAESDTNKQLAFGDIYHDHFADRHKGGYKFSSPEDPKLPDFDEEEYLEKARQGL